METEERKKMMFDRTRPMALHWDRPRNYKTFQAHPNDSKWTRKKFTMKVRAF